METGGTFLPGDQCQDREGPAVMLLERSRRRKMELERSLRTSCVRQNRGWDFILMRTRSLLKDFIEAVMFSLLKIAGCYEAREVGRLLE